MFPYDPFIQKHVHQVLKVNPFNCEDELSDVSLKYKQTRQPRVLYRPQGSKAVASQVLAVSLCASLVSNFFMI
jgi:hypothetical protein